MTPLLDEACPHVVDLNFWNVRTRLMLQTLEDVVHISSYYRDYVSDSSVGDADVTVWLCTSTNEAFTTTLLRPEVTKQVWIGGKAAQRTLWESFTVGARRATPLPPFSLEPLKSRVTLWHASAALNPGSGRAAVILGESGSGKSTALVGLLSRGWQFLSDDMCPVQANSVWKFTRPIGIRAGLYESLDQRTQKAIKLAAVPIETKGVRTWMAHPADLPFDIGPGEAEIGTCVRLERAPEFKAAKTGDKLVMVNWRPELDVERLVDLVSELTA